jgi:hypothetical protein
MFGAAHRQVGAAGGDLDADAFFQLVEVAVQVAVEQAGRVVTGEGEFFFYGATSWRCCRPGPAAALSISVF